jgi:hypothetical protein
MANIENASRSECSGQGRIFWQFLWSKKETVRSGIQKLDETAGGRRRISLRLIRFREERNLEGNGNGQISHNYRNYNIRFRTYRTFFK